MELEYLTRVMGSSAPCVDLSWWRNKNLRVIDLCVYLSLAKWGVIVLVNRVGALLGCGALDFGGYPRLRGDAVGEGLPQSDLLDSGSTVPE